MLVSKKHRKLVLNLREPERVTQFIPTAKTLVYKGKTLVAVPHRLDEVRVLKNLGFDVPPPIAHHYKYPGQYEPFIHQRATSEFLSINPRAFCLNDMGTGKTLSSLWSYDFLRGTKQVRRLLVISPLSTLERAWGDEIFSHFPHLTFTVLHGGTVERRLKQIAADFDIYIINHDGLKNKQILEALAKREDIDIIIVDELASFRNSSTERFKALNTLVNGNTKLGLKRREWVWGMTGTPIPQAPTDAWAQCRLINPAATPKSFVAFRETVMQQLTKFKWVAKDNALQTVKQVMQPSIRFERAECIDLPPTTYTTRQCDMSKEQVAAFNDMMRKLSLEFEGEQVTAVNEAVKLSKLLQVLSGTVYGANGMEIMLPCESRLALVEELVEEAEAKVLVFVPYTAALKHVAAHLSKRWSVATVYGDTPRGERDKIFSSFQKSADPHVLVVNPGTLSHGLTLTAANTIIWYCPIHSNEIYLQACARVTRPGQKLNTLIAHIEATKIERQIYERLKNKQRLQGLLLDAVKNDR